MLPKNRKESFYFTYDVEHKCIDMSMELENEYGMVRHYDNMPYSFAEEHVHPEDREEFIEAHLNIERGEKFATVDFRIMHPARWIRVCLFRADHKESLVSGFVQDVSVRYNYIMAETERKEAEINRRIEKEAEAHQLLYAVSESSDMMCSINLTANTYYLMSYNDFQLYQPEDRGMYDELFLVGFSTIPEEWQEAFSQVVSKEALWDAYERDEKYVYLEHQQYGGDKELHWVSTHVMFTENPYNDDVMAILVCRNIDVRRQKEEAQKRMLKDALLLAEKANDAKSDFLSRMSHDIRTPMNAIIGMATIAAANIEEQDKVKECLSKIGISSRFLLGLINDILDLSKIESGRMSLNIDTFSLQEILVGLVDGIRDLAQNKKQSVQFHITEDVRDIYLGDKVRVEQILLNLLNNAHKYTDEGGRLSLDVSRISGAADSDLLQFVVADNGRGISEEFLDTLFDPFAQGEDAGYRVGSGLGLAIVQNLVHLMDGTIRVETKQGEGSRFIVELPLRIPVEAEIRRKKSNQIFVGENSALQDRMSQIFENKGTTQQVIFQGQRVLLVEDNEINQEVAKTILEMHSLTVDVVDDGYQAIETITGSEPGKYFVVFMDIQMPGIDGYETTKRIRSSAHPDAKSIPIYAMTANAFVSDVDKARQCGMNGHIAKPVDFDVVAEILSELLNEEEA